MPALNRAGTKPGIRVWGSLALLLVLVGAIMLALTWGRARPIPIGEPQQVGEWTMLVHGAQWVPWLDAPTAATPAITQRFMVDISLQRAAAGSATPSLPVLQLQDADGRVLGSAWNGALTPVDGAVAVGLVSPSLPVECRSADAARAALSGAQALDPLTIPPGGVLRGWATFAIASTPEPVRLAVHAQTAGASSRTSTTVVTLVGRAPDATLAWADEAHAAVTSDQFTIGAMTIGPVIARTLPDGTPEPCQQERPATITLENQADEARPIPLQFWLQDADGRVVRPSTIGPGTFVLAPHERTILALRYPALFGVRQGPLTLIVRVPTADGSITVARLMVTEDPQLTVPSPPSPPSGNDQTMREGDSFIVWLC